MSCLRSCGCSSFCHWKGLGARMLWAHRAVERMGKPMDTLWWVTGQHRPWYIHHDTSVYSILLVCKCTVTLMRYSMQLSLFILAGQSACFMILVDQCSEQGCQMHLDSVWALLCTFHGISWNPNLLYNWMLWKIPSCWSLCSKASSSASRGLWDRRQLVLKHACAKPYARPPPNNTTRHHRYCILVTRGWKKTQAICGDFHVRLSGFRVLVFIVVGCEDCRVSGFSYLLFWKVKQS